jgi:titin
MVTNSLDSGPGSLRQAILDADNTVGQNTIRFILSNSGEVQYMPLYTALPPLTNPAGIIVDGTSEPLYRGAPLVELHEAAVPQGFSVLVITGGNSTVKGLMINTSAADVGLSAGIELDSGNNTVQGNWIGTDVGGTGAEGAAIGVLISGANNTVGGTTPGAGNVISGNRQYGIEVFGPGNVLQGNLIGTSAAGTAALPNGIDGVAIVNASRNTVGGTAAGAGNLISGNGRFGVSLVGAASANVVQQNRIGTNREGTAALPNFDGVALLPTAQDGPNTNTIGGTGGTAGNVISGNNRFGVLITGGTANQVSGNVIGASAFGTAAVPNALDGVGVSASGNTVGGTTAGAGNLISGNGRSGVYLVGSATTGNLVQGNRIGVSALGSAALANGADGVAVQDGAAANTVGGTATSAGNLISGNGRSGVLFDTGATGNAVQGNLIGTDAAGTAALPNALDGVSLATATNNTVGGTAAGAGNLISGNGRFGVFLDGTGATGNVVQQNAIGTDAAGTAALANAYDGVALYEGASNNTVGGTAPGAGNLVSANGRFGIYLYDDDTTGNLVQGNLIGVDRAGTAPLGNAFDGVAVIEPSGGNTIGGTTAAARNIISGNGRFGVLIGVEGTTGNLVQGNFIGTDVSGTLAVGNALEGVAVVTGASNNTVGGTVRGAGNTIAFNGGAGVLVGITPDDTETVGNALLGNVIHDNGGANGLGIDLGNEGPTPNGSGPDGPNHFQNFATLLTAVVNPDGTVTITFIFSSLASSNFRVEFFLNSAGEPAQGHFFLGAVAVAADPMGNLASVEGGTVTGGVGVITLTPPSGVTPTAGMQLTDTATLLSTPGGTGTPGDTSEFSFPAVVVTRP